MYMQHALQVYTKLAAEPWCSLYNITMVEYLTLLREENSKCLSLAIVKNESFPLIRSQTIVGSGSIVLIKALGDNDGSCK